MASWRPVLLTVALVLGMHAAPATAVDRDPLRAQQWNLDQVRAEAAWDDSVGSGQIIAVVDTGVDLDHPDLAGRVIGGTTFVGCADRIHGCGTGDWRDEDDGSGAYAAHGTHVAGIATATADNGLGVAGVAPGARLLAVKVLGADGSGADADIAAGIRWSVHNGADVINLSLGDVPGAQFLEGTIAEAVAEAVDAGVVVVAAAGNNVASLCAEPAFNGGVVCVVATDPDELRAAYSNLAVSEDMVVVAAPGGDGALCSRIVLSTYPVEVDPNCSAPQGYARNAGTSMAAPHVAGVAALLTAQGRAADEVIDVLIGTARHPATGARGSYDPAYGYGIVDAEAAVGEPVAGPVVRRAAGSHRIATAAEVSRRTHLRADTVVLTRADGYADALAGAPLAVHLRAPLLTSASHELSAPTAEEILRLGARRAILLGGTRALSTAVASDLRGMGLEVRRIAGTDRFDTSARIAVELPASDEVFVVEGAHPDPGRGWPDALSASGLAASLRAPILLVTRDTVPEATQGRLPAGVDVTIVGGEASVSASVEALLDRRHGTVRRLSGRDRYETSAAVAREALRRGRRPATTWLATGRGYADGLVAGAAAGMEDGLLMLIDGTDLDNSPAPVSFLQEHADGVYAARLAGGPAAISDRAERRLQAIAGR